MERYIVFIANITHSDVTVNCFLFEMKDGQQRPVVKGCFYELQGESPLRLNKAVMEIVSNGAESLSKNDEMSELLEEHSKQNETEKTLIIEGDNGTPGEKEMRDTQSVRDKDPSENTTESKEVVNGKRRENNNNDKTSDNISSQRNSNDNNNKTASKKPSTVITTETTNNNTATNNDNSNNNDNKNKRVSTKASTITAVNTTTANNITSENNGDNNSINDNNYKTVSAKASIVTAKGTNNISSQNNSYSSNNIKNGSSNNSNKENILSKNTSSENIRTSRKNNNNNKSNDNNVNFNRDNSNINNNNVNTTPTTIATTTTNNDESPRGQQPQNVEKRVELEKTRFPDGSFCFQIPSSQQNDLTDNLRNKLEAMPTPSNEKQQNDTIPHDTTDKKSRCRSQYDNLSSAETTPQTDEKRHEIHSEQERVIQEQPKPQNEISDRQISAWERFRRHFPF